MKHIPFARWCESISAIDLSTLPGSKPGDLRMPFSRDQAAEVLAKNCANGPLGLREIEELAINYIEANAGLKADETNKHVIKRAMRERERSLSPVDLDVLPDAPLSGFHLAYVESLLVPPGKSDFLSAINEAILDNEMYRHANALDALCNLSRQRGDHCYEWVIQGKLGDVLSKLQAGNLPGYKPDWLRHILRTQARCLAWFTACQRVRILRRLSTKPYDRLVEGFVPWPTVSHTCLATLIAPARLVVDMLEEYTTKDAQLKIAENPDEWLKSNGYLADNEKGRRIYSSSKNIRVLLSYKHGPTATQKMVESAKHSSLNLLKGLSRIKVGHLRQLGWTRLTYPELRLGVSASEGTAFVAMQLRQVLANIDELTNFQRNAGRATAPAAQYRLYHIATLLRGTIEPDKNSAQVGQSRKEPDQDCRLPNPYSNAGALPFRKIEKKLKSCKLRSKLQQVLGFTANRWFLAQA